MKLLIKKRSDRLKKRSKSPVKIQLSLGRFSIKIPNFGKIFLDFLSNSCSGDPPSSSREALSGGRDLYLASTGSKVVLEFEGVTDL